VTRTAALAALVALAGCGGCDDVPSGAVTDCTQGALVPGRVKTDILFVVDDSGSMAREQTELGTAFQGFIDALAAAPVGNDFRIGITNTSVDWPICRTYGAGGVCTAFDLQTSYPGGAPYNGAPYPAGALVAASGRPRILDAGSPTLVDDFVQNVRVGTGGSAKEQALRAMRLALSDRIADGSNAGFLRPGARLAVVIVGDEDDCSEDGPPQVIYAPGQDGCHSAAEQALLTPVQDYVDFLGGPVAGEVRPPLVAAVVGQEQTPPAPGIACNPGGYPGYRFFAFAGAFGASAQVADVCAPDFTGLFAAIATLLDPGQTMPLSGTPPDWRLLQVHVDRADRTSADCTVGLPGDPSAEVIYGAPLGAQPATLTFQGACVLKPGDAVQIHLLCAG
jgi:hypothetical protein